MVGAVLGALILLAWTRLQRLDLDTTVAMAPGRPWDARDLLDTFLVWALMMAAMMLPSASPMILLFAVVHRRRHEMLHPAVSAGVFTAGYLVVWAGFSSLAALAQPGLQHAALLSRHPGAVLPWVGGLLLLAAGLWELTPLKHACLARCQAPLRFIMTE